MFEGKIPEADLARARLGDCGEEALRDLSWAELSARLAAARELRRSLANGESQDFASFDPDSARRIAALIEGGQNIGELGVNSTNLAHGNQARGNNVGEQRGAKAGDTMTGNRGN